MEARTRVVLCVLAAALSACGESASKPEARTTTPLTVAPAATAPATVPATTPAISVALDCSGAVGVYNKMLVNYKEGAPMTRAQLDELAMRSFNTCTSAARLVGSRNRVRPSDGERPKCSHRHVRPRGPVLHLDCLRVVVVSR